MITNKVIIIESAKGLPKIKNKAMPTSSQKLFTSVFRLNNF